MSDIPQTETRITVKGRTYKLTPCLNENGTDSIFGQALEELARMMEACGQEDGEIILTHQPDEAEKIALEKVVLVFPNWKIGDCTACLNWSRRGDRMNIAWHNPDVPYNDVRVCLVHRVHE